jgi:hypothetical protein
VIFIALAIETCGVTDESEPTLDGNRESCFPMRNKRVLKRENGSVEHRRLFATLL